MQLNHTLNPIDEINHLRGVVSQESVTLSGIAHSLSNLLPSIQKNFQSFLSGFTTQEGAIDLKSNEKDFLQVIDRHVYLNLTPLLAHVPEGLNVPYLEYLRVLKDITEHCQEVALKTLNEYSFFLAQIITNRNFKYVSAPHDAAYAKMEKARNELTKRMAACFKTGSSKAEVNYGDVVTRNGEWRDVLVLLRQVSTTINKVSRQTLHNKAEECNNQLNLIIKQIKNNEFEGAGPEVTNNLSNGAYQAGAELELFTVAFFRTTTLNNAVSDTMTHVTKVLAEQR